MSLFNQIRAALSKVRRWGSQNAAWIVVVCAIFVGPCDRSAMAGETSNDRYLEPLPKGATARLGMLNLQQSPGDSAAVRCAPAISPDGTLAACGIEKQVVVWDITTGRVVRNITAFPKRIGALVFADVDTVMAIDSTIGDRGPRSKNTVKTWEVRTGKLLRSFEIAESDYSVFSHDAKMLATTWNTDQLDVWDVQTGKKLFSETERYPHVFFSPDDCILVTCRPQRIDEDRMVRILTYRESRTGKIIRRLELKNGNAVIGVSQGGKHLLAKTPILQKGTDYHNGYRLQVLHAQTGNVVHTLADRSSGEAKGFVFSPDGRVVAGEGSIWDVETGKKVQTFDWKGNFTSPAFSRDGKTVLHATPAGRVFVDDLVGGATRDLNPTHNSNVLALAFSADGKRLASTCGSQIYLWDVENGSAVNRCQVANIRKAPGSERDYAVKLAFAPDDKLLLAQQWDQSVRLYASAEGRELLAFRDAGHIWGFTDNGQHLHWTPTQFKPQSLFSPSRQPLPNDVDHWLSSARWVAAAAAYPKLGQFRAHMFVPTKLPEKEMRADNIKLSTNNDLIPFNLSPDGSILAECLWRPKDDGHGSWERIGFRFCNANTGKEIVRIPLKADDVLLWFAPDSRSFVTQVQNDKDDAREYSLILHETRTGQERLRIRRREASFDFNRHAFSRDGRWLAIGNSKNIEVFDLIRGASAVTIPHQEMNLRLAFSPDGTLLASGGNSRTILLWDMNAFVKREFNEPAWTAADQDGLWNDLASADAAKAFAAMMRLKRSPIAAVALMRERLRWRRPNADLGKLIKQLDGSDFAVRKKVADTIEQIGEGAHAALAEALLRAKSLEDRRRIESLMVRCERPFTTSERLRLLRSIEVLDALGTPASVKLLRDIAADSAGDESLQREVGRALERAGARQQE